MDVSDSVTGYRCLDCERSLETDEILTTCPECGGRLTVSHDRASLERAHATLFGSDQSPKKDAGLLRYASVLPFDSPDQVSLNEGATPLLECPVAPEDSETTVLLKDEGRNPTGSITDREMAVAVSGVGHADVDTVALPTTGAGGQSAAAYSALAGLDSESFVPSRAPFQHKAMINVHGGSMNVVGGRYPDAVSAFESARSDSNWKSLAVGDTPFRREGTKTIAYELVERLGGAPDVLVHPTGHGTRLRGIFDGFAELAASDVIESSPRLYAAQAEGCAPIVGAWADGEKTTTVVDHPDTICGTVEIPDPVDGDLALAALAKTDGGAVAIPDEVLLEAALEVAQAGVPVSATGGIGIAGVRHLLERGDVDSDDTVVVVNPVTANLEADLLRSRLMSKGV